VSYRKHGEKDLIDGADTDLAKEHSLAAH